MDALGIAGSMACGIIEYLAEGAWTKRMHPGWAAQAGFARRCSRARAFSGRAPCSKARTACSTASRTRGRRLGAMTDDFGKRWVTETLAFKPYACGTMTHPYIDCARRLDARGIGPDDVKEIVCETAEGTVHRLWEPLAAKQRPPNGYAAKFSGPSASPSGFVRGGVGLDAFTDATVRDPAVLALAAKVRYEIDPEESVSG